MYIKAPDQYPYTDSQLIESNPGVSFPASLNDACRAQFGVYPVTATPKPDFDPINQTLVEDTPIQVDGQWVQVWEVRASSAQEIADRKQAIKDEITNRVQQRLDEFARTRGYDNIVSACSYASSNHAKYGPEGRYCVQAREDTWDVLFQIEADVIAETRPMPLTYEDIEPELPVFAWPV